MKNIYVFLLSFCVITITQAQLIFTKAGGNKAGDYLPATSASVNLARGLAVDASGNIYIADVSNNRIRKITVATGIISTVAGAGTSGFTGDGGLATLATLNNPYGVVVDGSGNLYIGDATNNRIRKVTAATGIISTIAGNGTAAFAGDGGAATGSSLNNPRGVALDASGNLYISDYINHRIRKITVATGIISTVAGNGTGAFAGDGADATLASLFNPFSVAIDGTGNIYIADQNNNRIRKVNVATGFISTVAGNGTGTFAGDGGAATSGSLKSPKGVVVDGSGNIFIADDLNNRVRMVTAATGIISTVAGNGTAAFAGDGGSATSCSLSGPQGVVLDGTGNILIADLSNYRIRKVTTATGIISTVAGTGGSSFSGNGFAATSGSLSAPQGVAIDASGNIYIADLLNYRIRKITAAGIISTVAGNGIGAFAGDGGAATSASLSNPSDVAVDGSGNIYLTDENAHRIRKVTVATGIITTVAGNGTAAFAGDGAAATLASLNRPIGVTVDGSGDIYIADQNNNRIRKVTVATGIITTIAGNGTAAFAGDGAAATAASLNTPFAVAVESNGDIYIADRSNHRIRKVTLATGIISTVAGNGVAAFTGDGGAATSASLNNPFRVTLDGSSNLYIADDFNNRIRKVTAATGIITTVAGNGLGGFTGEGGVATSASLPAPRGIAVDGSGNMYIADQGNNRIRYVCAPAALPAATSVDARIFTVDNKTIVFNTNCNLYNKLVANGAQPVLGNVRDTVWRENAVPLTTGGQPYVQRHYGIVPQYNASTATGAVTLYYTQAELTAYNAAAGHGTDLPIDAADAANNKANLRVSQRSGTSNNASGLYDTYSGTITTIVPASVVWNAVSSAWEVTFSVTGFSGFFVSSVLNVLPVQLLSFSGRTDKTDGLLNWQTTDEINTAAFDIQRSTNGTAFTNAGTVNANNIAGLNNYIFTDKNIIDLGVPVVYYRLKIIDNNGRFTYSKVIPLNIGHKGAIVMLYPNPVHDVATVQISAMSTEKITYSILDIAGRTVVSKSLVINIGSTALAIDASNLSAGVYTLKLRGEKTNEDVKFIRE